MQFLLPQKYSFSLFDLGRLKSCSFHLCTMAGNYIEIIKKSCNYFNGSSTILSNGYNSEIIKILGLTQAMVSIFGLWVYNLVKLRCLFIVLGYVSSGLSL